MKCAQGGCFSEQQIALSDKVQVSTKGFNNVIILRIVLFSALHIPSRREANLTVVVMCCLGRSAVALHLLQACAKD